jgi:hypothetical protein
MHSGELSKWMYCDLWGTVPQKSRPIYVHHNIILYYSYFLFIIIIYIITVFLYPLRGTVPQKSQGGVFW